MENVLGLQSIATDIDGLDDAAWGWSSISIFCVIEA